MGKRRGYSGFLKIIVRARDIMVSTCQRLTLRKSYRQTENTPLNLDFKGGDRLKFGDVVTAVASLAVITTLLDSVLLVVLVPVISGKGVDVSGILSTLVASLIVGYLFALKIQEESRRGAIVSIVVLFTVVSMLATIAFIANPLASPAVKESMDGMFSTSGWTNFDWFDAMFMVVALNVVIALVFGFIGLYAGSMLRKPKKS